MENILFDKPEDSQRLSAAQRHMSNSSSGFHNNAGNDIIPLELRLTGLPHRPPGSTIKVTAVLQAETHDGIPCAREDLDIVIRAKLIELHCATSGLTYDVTTGDDYWLDEPLFERTRVEYAAGRLRGPWVLNVTVLQGTSAAAGSTTAAAGTLSSTHHNTNNGSSNNNNAGGGGGFTISALQQHQRHLALMSSSTNSSESVLSPADVNNVMGAMNSTSNNGNGAPLKPNTCNNNNSNVVVVRSVSIAQLRDGISNFPRGTWAITATVSDIRQKNESITELQLCQPELSGPRLMISAICFNQSISKALRMNVFAHCEIQIERAALYPKTDQDKRYQRDDHPYKIVLDGNAGVTVLRSAVDNAAQVALLHAAAVVSRQPHQFIMSNHTNGNGNINGGGGHATSIPGFASVDARSVALDRAGRDYHNHQQQQQQQQSSVSSTAGGMGVRHYSLTAPPSIHSGSNVTTASRPTTLFSNSSSGGSINSMNNNNRNTAAVAPTRTRFADLLQQRQQQQNQQQNQQQQEHHTTRSATGGTVICGAPAPSRRDIENRDGVVAAQSAQQLLAELVPLSATTAAVSSSSLSSAATTGPKRELANECFLCGVDSNSEASIETLKARLEKVRCNVFGTKAMSREEFMPASMEEVQRSLSDRRVVSVATKSDVKQEEEEGNKKETSRRLWCKNRVIDPLNRKAYRIHPRCAHLCTDFQSAGSVKLSDCTPRLECRICELCGEAGAITKCYDPTCDKWFHSTCAVFSRGHIDFGLYDPHRPCPSCPQHAYLVSSREKQKQKQQQQQQAKQGKNHQQKAKRRGRGEEDNDDEDDEDVDLDDPSLFDARKVEWGDLRDPDGI